MHRTLPVKVNDLNTFLTCPLCKGYLIDSCTINECLHSFCKSCIIKYVKKNESCPVCQVSIMKDRMNLFLKRDINLQNIVYKLVPNLFKNEMKRRRNFYSKHPKSVEFLKKRNIHDKEAVGELDEDTFLFDTCTDISLSIEYSETGLSEICDSIRLKETDPSVYKSYLQCPGSFTIDSLKKFLSLKNDFISTKFLDIMYDDKPLNKDLTLIDVAYIYAWRRTAPMRLFYRINKPLVEKESKPIVESLVESSSINTNNNEVTITSTTNTVLNPIDNNKLTDSPNKNLKKIEKDEKEISSSINIDKQSKSFKEVEENKNDYHNRTAEISVNNSTTTTTTTTKEDNQPNENLTITAMVASISVKKEKTPIKCDNQQTKLSESNEFISNSDKENEEEKSKLENTIINKSSQQQQHQQLPVMIQQQPTIHIQNQHHQLNTNYYESNLSNHQNYFDSTNKQNSDIQHQPLPPLPLPLKQIKPKSQKPMKKKEALIATNNNNNNNNSFSSDQLNNSIMSTSTKKVKQNKTKPQTAQNPMDLSNKFPITPNLQTESSSAPSNQQYQQQPEHHLQHHQQQQQQQFAAAAVAAAAAAAHYSLPTFTTKLNSNVNPTLPSMMPPNFQLMPNMNLMSHLMSSANSVAAAAAVANPNSMFHNYTASQQQQAHVANALMNPKFNPAFLEYFQSKASQSFQQTYLNNSFGQHNLHHHHTPFHHPLAQHHSQYPDDYKKSFTGFNSTSYDQQMQSNYTGQQQHSNFNTDLMRNFNYLNSNNNNKSFNMNGQDVQQNNFSNSSSSSCSSNDDLQSLKETQLRISESCNLVNESS